MVKRQLDEPFAGNPAELDDLVANNLLELGVAGGHASQVPHTGAGHQRGELWSAASLARPTTHELATLCPTPGFPKGAIFWYPVGKEVDGDSVGLANKAADYCSDPIVLASEVAFHDSDRIGADDPLPAFPAVWPARRSLPESRRRGEVWRFFV